MRDNPQRQARKVKMNCPECEIAHSVEDCLHPYALALMTFSDHKDYYIGLVTEGGDRYTFRALMTHTKEGALRELDLTVINPSDYQPWIDFLLEFNPKSDNMTIVIVETRKIKVCAPTVK